MKTVDAAYVMFQFAVCVFAVGVLFFWLMESREKGRPKANAWYAYPLIIVGGLGLVLITLYQFVTIVRLLAKQ
jgi:hypothetical protein